MIALVVGLGNVSSGVYFGFRANNCLQAYVSMRFPHVVINPCPAWKGLHTDPADVRLALGACHVVAAHTLLDVGLAFWTRLHTIVLLPLAIHLFCRVAFLPPLRTRKAIMSFDVTRGAYVHKAGPALDRGSLGSGSVHLRAVWRGAVLVVVRMHVEIRLADLLE